MEAQNTRPAQGVPGQAALAPAGAEAAIRNGLDWVEREVGRYRAWPIGIYRGVPVDDPIDPDRLPPEIDAPPFGAAWALLALEVCEQPAAARLREFTRTIIWEDIEYPGVWRYWPILPPDLDSTALCSLTAGGHPWVLFGRNLGPALSCLDGEGRFRTWMMSLWRGLEPPPDGGDPDIWEDVDPVVNANILAWLGDRPETRGAQRWLETLVLEKRESDAHSSWYANPLDLLVAMVRARRYAPPVFAGLGAALADRILDRRHPAGHFGDVTRTAQALTALDLLDAPARADMAPALEYLVAAQREDGSWPAEDLYRHVDQTNKNGSHALTSIWCVEALTRYS